MKVFITDIKDDIYIAEELIEAKEWDLDTDELKFIGDIGLHAEFSRAGHEIIVDLIVKMRRQMTCCRCLEVFERDDDYAFMLSYDSTDCPYELDINEDIREEILLNWPMKCLCSDDCKGLDPNTGNKIK